MIIGLAGLAGSGKSTVARHLVEKHGFVRLAFADPMKQALMGMGFSEAQVYGDLKETVIEGLGVTPRYVMQKFGTEFGRQTVRDTLWVDLWTKRALELGQEGKNVVADDVRFPNEVEVIDRLGGWTSRIERSGLIPGRHASEAGIMTLDVHGVITNSGTLEELYADADHALKCAGFMRRT